MGKRDTAFLLPGFDLGINYKNQPELEPGYDQTDGFKLKYGFSAPVTDKLRWRISGQVIINDYSDIHFGYKAVKDNTSNYGGVYYNFKGYWGIEDKLTNDTPWINTTIDGYREFTMSDTSELGFSITRKYWGSPVGNWQFGILGRKVYALDGKGIEYGGTYGGYRLDYKPHPWVTLSLLRLYSFDGGDYRDFMSDFKTGSNWLYNTGIPINSMYSLGLDGAYNFEQSLWIHRIYRVNRESDCFSSSFGWDDAVKSWLCNIAIKF